MTNNKQQTEMKRYTEEEIVSFLKREFSDEINAETFMENLSPIELPSDEEIQKESNNEYQEQKQSYENSVEMFPIDFANYLEVGFIDGAKWMRDKIQGNDKQ